MKKQEIVSVMGERRFGNLLDSALSLEKVARAITAETGIEISYGSIHGWRKQLRGRPSAPPIPLSYQTVSSWETTSD